MVAELPGALPGVEAVGQQLWLHGPSPGGPLFYFQIHHLFLSNVNYRKVSFTARCWRWLKHLKWEMKNILCVSHSSGVPLPSALWVIVVSLLLLLGQKDTPEEHNMYFKNNNSTFNLCMKTLALCWEILSALLQLATRGTRSDSHKYALPLTSFRWPTFRWHVFILNYSFIPSSHVSIKSSMSVYYQAKLCIYYISVLYSWVLMKCDIFKSMSCSQQHRTDNQWSEHSTPHRQSLELAQQQ